MIIVLLLFFKSLCLYCQRLVLHVHDRWINPKNVRIIREAAEAKGVKIIPEEYRQPSKKSKRRRYAYGSNSSSAYSPSSGPSAVLSALGKVESCHFCANTPQGYCRHHFHLQELQIHKQQQKIWCPLAGGFSNRSVDYKQLRKIKRDLKQTLHQKTTKPNYTHYTNNNATHQSVPAQAQACEPRQSVNSCDDSGYQTNSLANSQVEESEQLLYEISLSGREYVDIPSPNSMIETTYSFKSCSESESAQPLVTSVLPRDASAQTFMSCGSSTISTSYL